VIFRNLLLGLVFGLGATYGQRQGNEWYWEFAEGPLWAVVTAMVAVLAFAATIFVSLYSAERHGWTGSRRGLWALGILLGAPVTVPAYWFLSWRTRLIASARDAKTTALAD